MYPGTPEHKQSYRCPPPFRGHPRQCFSLSDCSQLLNADGRNVFSGSIPELYCLSRSGSDDFSALTKATVWGSLLGYIYIYFEVYVCSGSGSLAQVTPCSFAVSSFSAVLTSRHEPAMEWERSYDAPTTSPNVCLSVRHIITRASGSHPAVKMGGTFPTYRTLGRPVSFLIFVLCCSVLISVFYALHTTCGMSYWLYSTTHWST